MGLICKMIGNTIFVSSFNHRFYTFCDKIVYWFNDFTYLGTNTFQYIRDYSIIFTLYLVSSYLPVTIPVTKLLMKFKKNIKVFLK